MLLPGMQTAEVEGMEHETGRGRLRVAAAAALAVFTGGCGAGGAGPEARGAGDLAGTWRAVLASPGGELPFTLEVRPGQPGAPAVARNGGEEAPFTSVEFDGERALLRIDGYDAQIVATLDPESGRLQGEWTRTAASGAVSRLPFAATRGAAPRFDPELPQGAAGADPGSLTTVAGAWAVVFRDAEGEEPARAQFHQSGHGVTGTFLTPTGDYRYLEGDYRQGFLRLSTFDGSHAFLFHARARPDGTLAGDFWSRDTYHATWTATPLPPGGDDTDGLPDPFGVVHLTSEDGRLRFRFPDLDGNLVSLEDDRFRGKVVVVTLFGSWCPNCNDEAPLLADWHRRFGPEGLELVGLAFEFTGDAARDRRFVRKFAQRHGLSFPLLLAGVSDKASASASLPDLSRVAAYPTTLFVDRSGKVRRIQSGFAGPATGARHQELVAEMESIRRELRAETAPAAGAVRGGLQPG